VTDHPERTSRALVLARGLGTRMREQSSAVTLDPAQASAADAGVKAMISFGRPFLDYVLHSLADAGVREAALVLGPEHDRVRDYYRNLPTVRISIGFVEQQRPLGTADAVLAARQWADDRPFIVLNADNLYPVDVLTRLVAGTEPAVPGFERHSLGLPLERLGAFALLEAGADGTLQQIVEKPGAEAMDAAGPRALISMNAWRFDDRIFAACRDVPLSSRNERELPQAVGLAVRRGVRFEVFPVRGEVLDLSKRDDIPRVAQALERREIRL
jgi:glucose-1-phosphate thymidylyltransferase